MSDFCEHTYSRSEENPLADYIELEGGFVHKDCHKAVACQYSDGTESETHLANAFGQGGFACDEHRELLAAQADAELWRIVNYDEESESAY